MYLTRYARVLPDGTREKWHQTVERVVNGTMRMQERWFKVGIHVKTHFFYSCPHRPSSFVCSSFLFISIPFRSDAVYFLISSLVL